MFKIRKAQENDYKLIYQLEKSSTSMRLMEDDSIIGWKCYNESLFIEQGNWFVVENSGELIAFAFYSIDEDNTAIDVKKFTIHGDYKKKGINEHLYKKLEQLAFQRALLTMRVEISNGHLDVIDFFERKGWVRENNQLYAKYIRY